MNDEQLNRLFQAARQSPPDTAPAELGFETRLVARLRADEPAALWIAWSWRLAPVFAAVVLALGAWNYLAFRAESHDLAAAITSNSEDAWLFVAWGGE